MNLINNTLAQRFKQLGSQGNTQNPIVVARFKEIGFSRITWHATAYDPKKQEFYGCVVSDDGYQWQTFTLKYLESICLPYSIGVERDLNFKEAPIAEYVPEIKRALTQKELQLKPRISPLRLKHKM